MIILVSGVVLADSPFGRSDYRGLRFTGFAGLGYPNAILSTGIDFNFGLLFFITAPKLVQRIEVVDSLPHVH